MGGKFCGGKFPAAEPNGNCGVLVATFTYELKDDKFFNERKEERVAWLNSFASSTEFRDELSL
jgi:hypothetical protein